MKRDLDITYEGETVRGPALSRLATLLAPLAVLGGTFMFLCSLLLVFVLLPVLLPLHFLLKACGRRGFATENEGGTVNYVISGAGFRKA